MKKLTILVVTLLTMVITAQAQEFQKLFDKYSNDERFSYVSLGAEIIKDFGLNSMLPDFNLKTNQIVNIKGMKVLTLKSEKDGKLMKSAVDEFANAIKNDSKAKPLVETRENGDITNIHLISEGLIIITKNAKELTIVFIAGELKQSTK
ncbi:MAG: DUF4252 domain-containing protein [Prevotellaceae bacterium]|jgi:hypothetical protein|nr:DUF4252 domain-containing protein [Prevotellaceae bacterium]